MKFNIDLKKMYAQELRFWQLVKNMVNSYAFFLISEH
jgi:hypothetical protein